MGLVLWGGCGAGGPVQPGLSQPGGRNDSRGGCPHPWVLPSSLGALPHPSLRGSCSPPGQERFPAEQDAGAPPDAPRGAAQPGGGGKAGARPRVGRRWVQFGPVASRCHCPPALPGAAAARHGGSAERAGFCPRGSPPAGPGAQPLPSPGDTGG